MSDNPAIHGMVSLAEMYEDGSSLLQTWRIPPSLVAELRQVLRNQIGTPDGETFGTAEAVRASAAHAAQVPGAVHTFAMEDDS
ncbi:hypothetical protein [Microtetraspora niveoalba]|uniref:hypothetical protein n=1 Tax=Microtetraspora niveoalba TaxID=46175 RepID=UPI00082AEBB5|nr:hypothetical protein [Microtetraspora niveoalba]